MPTQLISNHARHNNNSVELLEGQPFNQCQADLEHDTLATSRFRYRCSEMLILKMKKTAVTVTFIHIYQVDLASH